MKQSYGKTPYNKVGNVTERKQAEQQLAEQARVLQQQAKLLELSSEAIFVRDERGTITYWNRGAEVMYGWMREEVIGLVPDTLLETQNPKSINLDNTLLQQESWQGELIRTCKNGRQLIVESRQVLIRDEQGNPTGFLEVNCDITVRKQAEIALRESEERMHSALLNLNQELQRQLAESQTLLEVIPIGVGIAEDSQCKKIRVNSAFAQMLSISSTVNASLSAPEDERPKNFKVYCEGQELSSEDLPLQRAAALGIEVRDLEVDVVWNDGTALTLLEYAAPLFDECGKVRGSIGAFLNITERKRAEMALQQTLKDLADFKFALDRSSIVAITDTEGTLAYVNDKFCELSQYSREELIGQNHRVVNSGYHPKEFFQHLWATITRGQVWQGEIKNRAKDGTFYWVATTIVPFLDVSGKPYQYIAVHTDITTRKMAEVELQQLNITLEQRVEERTIELQEVNKDLEAFSYTVAHDLRAPLRGIQGFAQALAEDYDDRLDETAREYIQHIFRGTEVMSELVHDLLAYSRLSREKIKLAPVQLAQVIADARSQLATDLRERQAQIASAENLPIVMGHHPILVQIIVNLFSNAIKFITPGIQPYIRVWAETIELKETRESGEDSSPSLQQVRLWIEDNGIGIEPNYQEQIFGVFERLHSTETYPGTGIGLAIVRKGAERLGGRAGVESTLGQGSRFWIELQESTDQ
ncbi:PAS domain S-box protein [Scytonema sp. NUACC26]|uniref:PAS domain-containing sensor histidine kinase n=1 Tax=Scytonema sp. NUACC26 TaxID=3140176 RepID=UPI0034DC2DDB